MKKSILQFGIIPDYPDFRRYWVGAAITGAATLAGLGIQAAAANNLSHKAVDRNKRIMDYQTEINERLYNQYQSPAAMMRQYREAGLNPNLVYGNTAPSAPDAGSYGNQNEVYPVDYQHSFDAMATAVSQAVVRQQQREMFAKEQDMRARALDIQQQNADTNTENKAYQNANYEANTRSKWLQTRFQAINLKYLDEHLRLRNKRQDLVNEYQLAANTAQNIRMSYALTLEQKMMEQELANLVKSGQLRDEEIRRIQSQINVLGHTAKYLQSQTRGQTLANEIEEFLNSQTKESYETIPKWERDALDFKYKGGKIDLQILDKMLKEGHLDYQGLDQGVDVISRLLPFLGGRR